MKEFSEFEKEDQRLICEAMQTITRMSTINSLIVRAPPTQEDLERRIKNMSCEAREFLIEKLKNID